MLECFIVKTRCVLGMGLAQVPDVLYQVCTTELGAAAAVAKAKAVPIATLLRICNPCISVIRCSCVP
jgi:hypothetical protein